MGFNILYQPGQDVNHNTVSLAVFLNHFAEGFLGRPIQIDLESLTKVAASLLQPDFPHTDGLERASPFKKAANFFIWFIIHRPIITDFSSDVKPELAKIDNHQNVIIAFAFAVSCLEGAKLYKKDGTEVTLSKRIMVSEHFYCDLIEAFASVVHSHHFKVASLLFEQLAYKANPDAPYSEIVG